MTALLDAHVRVGEGRDVSLDAGELLEQMDALGIERTLVSPAERQIAYANREGNERVTALCRAHPGRLFAYAVATPWRGAEALDELRWARSAGAIALAVDPVLQGFDLLDGLLDPLLRFAADASWPVYVRTGTPPAALPLQLAELARRHADVPILMGRSGATDFIIDAQPALRRAGNLYADTSHVGWDTLLGALADDPEIGPGRIVFSTDAPYAIPAAEIERIQSWPLPAAALQRVLGENMSELVGDD
jgi:predicted TIM-barrel fold metal-dependent hydrolase